MATLANPEDGTVPSPGVAPLLGQMLEALCGLMLLGIVGIVFGNVIARYFLRIGLGWSEEAARFLLIWMSFTGAAAAVRRWGHFQLIIVTAWVPAALHRAMQVFALLVVMTLAQIMMVHGREVMLISWAQTSPVLDWNMGAVYAVVPASGALMLLFALLHLRAVLRGGSLPLAGAVAEAPPGNA